MVSLSRDQEINLAGNTDAMRLFIFNGGGLSKDEVDLGTPDDTEAKNLNHHVSRCAMRFRMFTQRQTEQGNDISQIKYLVIALMIVVLLTNPQLHTFIDWLSKVF